MTGRPLVGLLCALFVESAQWIKLRWDFDDSSYESAWQLSFVLMILTALVIWLDESSYTAILVMIGWLPPMLMPLQFVQSYGMKDSVQLTAFSLLAQRSRLRSERLGLIHESVSLNFGNVTFIVALLSSAAAMSVDSFLYVPGLVVLAGWMLIASGRCRWRSLAPLLVVSGGLALAGQQGLERLEKWVRSGGGAHNDHFNPNFHHTRIGQRGRVLLSPEVMWRLTTETDQKPPQLLRTLTFNIFRGATWQNQRLPFSEIRPTYAGVKRHIIDDNIAVSEIDRLPEFRLRGSVDKTFAMPLPGSVVSLSGLGNAEVGGNALGTVQIKPEASVVDVGVHWFGEGTDEKPLWSVDRDGIAPADRDVIQQVADELALSELPDLRSKLARLEKWYRAEFRYTLDLTIRPYQGIGRPSDSQSSTPIEQFLTEVRAGHCEYFATSAALILRASGVPARYAVGFGVLEQSKEENQYLIRGTHAHAWVRVWDEQNETWIDFDPTPPDWTNDSAYHIGWAQKAKDAMKRLREDFFLWRTNPDNEMIVVSVVTLFGLALFLFVIRRLWRSRSHIESRIRITEFEGSHQDTPLHELESLVRRCIGPRPAGMTYARWLRSVEDKAGELIELDEAIQLHQQWRYDPMPVEEGHQQRLRELVKALETTLRAKIREKQEV